SALKKLNDLGIRSSNKPWNKDKEQRGQDLGVQRATNNQQYWDDFGGYASVIAQSKLGNCWERGTVFAYFASQSPDIGKSHLYRVEAARDGADHVWAVLTTGELTLGSTCHLSDLGKSGVVLDGWTEDWWFPNVGPLDTIAQNCWRGGNPFQLFMRAKIQKWWPKFKVNEKCC
ncbi:MAG: hypothetical protein ACRC33_20090, partial [Gemmataceae bacterium]